MAWFDPPTVDFDVFSAPSEASPTTHQLLPIVNNNSNNSVETETVTKKRLELESTILLSVSFMDFVKHHNIHQTELELLFEHIPWLPFPKYSMWIAGGCLLKTKIGCPIDEIHGDIDFYFDSQESFEMYQSELFNNKYNLDIKYIDTSLTNPQYRLNLLGHDYILQLIQSKYFSNVHDLLSSFDFTIVQLATDKESVYFNNYHTLHDIGSRLLRFVNIRNSVSALDRAQKYIKRGFTLDNKEMRKILDIGLDGEDVNDSNSIVKLSGG